MNDLKINKIVKDYTTDIERAFYGENGIKLENVSFDGPQDGESALKESKNIILDNCYFNLRYPFWHDENLYINTTELTDKCRAAIWYSKNINVDKSKLNGIKVFRECINTNIQNSSIDSKECFWLCENINIKNTSITTEYPFFQCKDITIDKLELHGKYSFQYCSNVTVTNSNLDTKDAFWGSKNITVKDSIVKGEYLAWYAEDLTLINCEIIGTQPLCYCKNLKLINCKMINCDLSFEYSDVEAEIIGSIDSVKNPYSGKIEADDIKEIILDEHFIDKGVKITKRL